MTTYAITGATGQLGRLAVDELLKTTAASDVVAIVRNEQKAADLTAKGVKVRIASYGDAPALTAALKGVDRLLLISGSEVGQRFPQHRSVIDAAKAAGVKYLVYTSLSKADTSSMILAPEHKATEEYLASSGVPFAVVRNNWYTENYIQSVNAARAAGVLLAAAGTGKVASATRADYAAGAIKVLESNDFAGQYLEFTGTTAWSYDELAAAMSAVIGAPIVYKPVDAASLIEALKAAGLDEGTAGFVAALDTGIAAGELEDVSDTLTKLLGRPTTGLEEGLKAALESQPSRR